jgi:hypothetical protein
MPAKIIIVAMLLSPLVRSHKAEAAGEALEAVQQAAHRLEEQPAVLLQVRAPPPVHRMLGPPALVRQASAACHPDLLMWADLTTPADPSGAGNSAKVPTAPGTNTLGTANSSGSPGGTTGLTTTGMANTRAGTGNGGRIDGTVTPGPSMPGDAEIRAEDPKVDAKIKSICKGC